MLVCDQILETLRMGAICVHHEALSDPVMAMFQVGQGCLPYAMKLAVTGSCCRLKGLKCIGRNR